LDIIHLPWKSNTTFIARTERGKTLELREAELDHDRLSQTFQRHPFCLSSHRFMGFRI
jgi:hypothetical protein